MTGQLAVACTMNYGAIGAPQTALYILECDRSNLSRTFDWHEGLLDLCWSKSSPDFLLTSSIDASMQLWHIKSAESESASPCKPVQVYKEHTAEVQSIDWNFLNQNPQILTGSWDSTCKLWDPNYSQSLITFSDDSCNYNHKNLIYSVSFSGNLFCSSGSDGYLRMWSTNSATAPFKAIKVGIEALSCHWSEHDPNLIAVGNEVGNILMFDVRQTERPLKYFQAGDLAVKQIKFSPNCDLITSVGFDTITR